MNQSTNIPTTQPTKQNIGALLKSRERQITAALPKHITTDRLMRIALTEISRNEELKKCTAESLIRCVIQAAQLGLLPDSLTGEAYLIPFNNRRLNIKECQFIVGYRGLMKLAYQSGQIINIFAREFYEKDHIDIVYGLNPKLDHIPCLDDTGSVKGYYAVAKFKNGTGDFFVMAKKQMAAYGAKLISFGKGPWQTHFDEMAKKTVIRKLLKYLPRSSDNLVQAIVQDERAEIGKQINAGDVFDMDTTPATEDKSQIKAQQLAKEMK